jgi:hypothetical protein
MEITRLSFGKPGFVGGWEKPMWPVWVPNLDEWCLSREERRF